MAGHGRWVGRIDAKDPDNLSQRRIVSPSPEKWGDRAKAGAAFRSIGCRKGRQGWWKIISRTEIDLVRRTRSFLYFILYPLSFFYFYASLPAKS